MKPLTILFLSGLMALSTGISIAAQSEILAKLQTNEAEANERIFGSLTGGYFSPVGDPGVFKAAAPEARAAMVKAVMALARAYTSSADFTRRYREARESEKPSAPTPQLTGEQLRAQQRQGLEEAIANATKMARDFQAKDNRWKILYRAGKPAVDAARTAAQEWLKALGV